MTTKRKLILLVAFAGACACVAAVILTRNPGDVSRLPDEIVVSRETTFLTAPLNNDGLPDYARSIDRTWGEGVTADNNAAIPLIEVLGAPGHPIGLSEEAHQRMLQRFGGPDFPPDAPYLERYRSYLERTGQQVESRPFDEQHPGDSPEDVEDRYFRATERPWMPEELPTIAEWLKSNEAVLEKVAAAVERPRYYVPLVDIDRTNSGPPVGGPGRALARVIAARAMGRIGAGQPDAALEDALVLRKLAGHIDSAPGVIDSLVAYAILGLACRVEEAVLDDNGITAEAAQKYAAELSALSPLRPLSEKYDRHERFFVIHSLLQWRSMLFLQAHGGEQNHDFLKAPVDWNQVLREANRWSDLLVEATSAASYAECLERIEELERSYREAVQLPGLDSTSCMELMSDSALASLERRHGESRADWKARATEVMEQQAIGMIFLAPQGALVGRTRAQAHRRLAQVAYALTAYAKEHGQLPGDLSELNEQHLPDLPKDPFSDEPFRYERSEESFRLYSVGPNMIDDAGQNDLPEGTADDILIEVRLR